MLLNEQMVLILAAVLAALAVAVTIAMVVLRRWHGRTKNSNPPRQDAAATPRAARLMDAVAPKMEAFAWKDGNPEDGAGDDFDRQQAAVLGRNKTILVADDDPVVLSALTRRLQRLGYNVMRSPDASHALLGAAKVLPDLLILDVNMPSGNGLAVCEMMACDRRCAHIPVIVHSVLSDDVVKQRCQRLGAHYVEKSPQSWTEIKALVESLLGEHNESPSQADDAPPQPDASTDPSAGEEPSAPSASLMTVPDASPPPKPAPAGRRLVLCIESPRGRLEAVEHQLLAIGIEVSRWTDLEESFWTCFTEKPFAIIVQISDNKKGLLALLARLAEHPVTRAIPVLVVNENNAIAETELQSAGNMKILKYPADWEDLLCELEPYLPAVGDSQSTSAADDTRPGTPSDDSVDGMDRAPSNSGLPSAAAGASKESLTIVCIDDDPVVAKSIANRLQPYPIHLKWANNGTQGYLLAVSEMPDLILLDLKMPNGEGNYVLSKLKDNPQTKSIPVIVLTVETHRGVRRQMFAIGADAYLNKPIQWPELFAEMGRCVRLPKQLLQDYKLKDELTLAEL